MMTTTLDYSTAAIQCTLLATMIDMATQGTKKAPAGEILGHSSLQITNIEVGRVLMGMGVPYVRPGGQKHYLLDGDTLAEIQAGLVEEAPVVMASIPDLDPVIKDLTGKLSYWATRTEKVRVVKADIAANQRELKAAGYENQWQISSWEDELASGRHILGILKKEKAQLEAIQFELSGLPTLAELQAELTTATEGLAIAKADMERRRTETERANIQASQYNQAFRAGTAPTVPTSELPKPKAPWWPRRS